MNVHFFLQGRETLQARVARAVMQTEENMEGREEGRRRKHGGERKI
jgi:hypothetical protein